MNNPNAAKNLTAPRFKKGQTGNPGGKTSEQKRIEMRNAEKAVAIRGRLLDALSDAMDIIEPERLLEYLNPNTLKMLKDSEDRGFGAPVQPIISPDSSMRPTVIKLVARDFPNT